MSLLPVVVAMLRGPRPHVEVDAALQPRYEEVRALIDHRLLDSRHPVEDDGPRAAADVVDGRREQRRPDAGGDRYPVEETH